MISPTWVVSVSITTSSAVCKRAGVDAHLRNPSHDTSTSRAMITHVVTTASLMGTGPRVKQDLGVQRIGVHDQLSPAVKRSAKRASVKPRARQSPRQRSMHQQPEDDGCSGEPQRGQEQRAP